MTPSSAAGTGVDDGGQAHRLERGGPPRAPGRVLISIDGVALVAGIGAGKAVQVSENPVELRLDDAGLAADLPRPEHPHDQIQEVPFRPVQFRDDDLPTALERSASWLRGVQAWLGEPVDVIAIHLDYDDQAGSPYYEVKLLCNDEDLAGAPVAMRAQQGPE